MRGACLTTSSGGPSKAPSVTSACHPRRADKGNEPAVIPRLLGFVDRILTASASSWAASTRVRSRIVGFIARPDLLLLSGGVQVVAPGTQTG